MLRNPDWSELLDNARKHDPNITLDELLARLTPSEPFNVQRGYPGEGTYCTIDMRLDSADGPSIGLHWEDWRSAFKTDLARLRKGLTAGTSFFMEEN